MEEPTSHSHHPAVMSAGCVWGYYRLKAVSGITSYSPVHPAIREAITSGCQVTPERSPDVAVTGFMCLPASR